MTDTEKIIKEKAGQDAAVQKADEQIEALLKKLAQAKERKSDAEKKAQAKIRAARTHRLCIIGGDIERIFGGEMDTDGEIYHDFLRQVEEWFSGVQTSPTPDEAETEKQFSSFSF